MFFPQGGTSYQYLLRDIYEDLIQRMVDISFEDNIFVAQPCRDNTLYLLKLVDEMLISELDNKLPVLNVPEIDNLVILLHESSTFYYNWFPPLFIGFLVKIHTNTFMQQN